eukprot:Skav204277  [mRNA]  locus=scaffold409:127300:139917:+ [translate_table: standard]
MGGCCSCGGKKVLRPNVDAEPLPGGCYTLQKSAPLMKSPSRSAETQNELKKQAKVLVLSKESAGFYLVLPEPPLKAGWLAKPLPVSLRRLKGSRDEIEQVLRNQEVVLLELGLSCAGAVVGRVKTCEDSLSASTCEMTPVQGGSLVHLCQLQHADEGLWMQVCVQDGPNSGQSGWIQSKKGTDRLLVDFREQWEGEQQNAPVEAMSPTAKIVKLTDTDTETKKLKSDTLAEFEIPDGPADAEEIDRDDAERQLSCGYCVCRVIPAERTAS